MAVRATHTWREHLYIRLARRGRKEIETPQSGLPEARCRTRSIFGRVSCGERNHLTRSRSENPAFKGGIFPSITVAVVAKSFQTGEHAPERSCHSRQEQAETARSSPRCHRPKTFSFWSQATKRSFGNTGHALRLGQPPLHHGWMVTPPGLGPSTRVFPALRALRTKVLLSPCFDHGPDGTSLKSTNFQSVTSVSLIPR